MRLNQVIALEKGTKSKVQADIDQVYKAIQKPALFDGHTKTYRAHSAEDYEQVPPDTKNVQLRANEALMTIAQRWTELFDLTAQKDYANCEAWADVKVEGKTLLEQAPVTYLLFLEKALTDLYTIASKIPTLDPAERWELDTGTGLYKTQTTQTTRTKKVQRPIVLLAPTTEHPGQAQLITEDVGVGTWDLVKVSGAMPEPRKKELLERIKKVQEAVKVAREEANVIDAPKKQAGAAIFGYILGSV